MEFPIKTVFGIVIFLIVFILIVYALIQQGILSGFMDMIGLGGDWMAKLFSPVSG